MTEKKDELTLIEGHQPKTTEQLALGGHQPAGRGYQPLKATKPATPPAGGSNVSKPAKGSSE